MQTNAGKQLKGLQTDLLFNRSFGRHHIRGTHQGSLVLENVWKVDPCLGRFRSTVRSEQRLNHTRRPTLPER